MSNTTPEEFLLGGRNPTFAIDNLKSTKENSMSLASDLIDKHQTYVMKGSFEDRALDIYHLILAPSYACNLSCPHCYLPNHAHSSLPFERVVDLIDEWSDIVLAERGRFGGIFHLKGGEPLMLPYLDDVLELLGHKRTLRFMMTTNGVADDLVIIRALARLNEQIDGHASVIVSLDGSNDEINSQLRGVGNFSKTVGFIREIREAGITTYLNYVVHNDNIDDIDNFVGLALDLDVAQINFLNFVPKGVGEQMSYKRPAPLKVFKRVHGVWENGDKRVRELLSGSLSDILHEESHGICTSNECVGGYKGLLYIVPDGTSYSCPNLDYINLSVGNIMTSKLCEIYNRLGSSDFMKAIDAKSKTPRRYSCQGDSSITHYSALEITPFNANSTTNDQCTRATSYCYSRNF
jgi:MoaA/NifB/PqqE/SkfB family radical SAM enzyme